MIATSGKNFQVLARISENCAMPGEASQAIGWEISPSRISMSFSTPSSGWYSHRNTTATMTKDETHGTMTTAL